MTGNDTGSGGRLRGKRGLVIGIANLHSIAYGCAQALASEGAELAVTYLNDKARPYVEPCAGALGARLCLPLDVTDAGQMEALFEAMDREWGGRLDFLIHSIAFAPRDDLHGRVADSSREGFLQAMDISCHSFARLAKLAEPRMQDGGSLLTVSYYGAEKVVAHYGMMGPVKAALESMTRYLAQELGPKGIRVNALSPGPIATRAAGGIQDFSALLDAAQVKSPLRRLATIEDVGAMAAFLCGEGGRNISGQVMYIDAGYEIVD